jgi:uncharacterized membrane protein
MGLTLMNFPDSNNMVIIINQVHLHTQTRLIHTKIVRIPMPIIYPIVTLNDIIITIINPTSK